MPVVSRNQEVLCGGVAGGVELKVKFTLEQAMKGQRGNRGIALLFI
jgi:hypothetical protein